MKLVEVRYNGGKVIAQVDKKREKKDIKLNDELTISFHQVFSLH